MSVNKKYKILLTQLPLADFDFSKLWGNIPLAAGYLKALAHKEGLLNEVDIEILGEKDINLSSDSRLVDLIISKSPDMLGFSLYVWNSIRSLFIAQEVKKKLPNIKIVGGGPEVTLETNYILDNPAVDIGCIGEGEFTFVDIIKNILKGQKDYASIKGIFYRRRGQIVVTPPGEPIKDLDQIPSPYTLGFINPKKDYSFSWYETTRGCPFKCAYCTVGLMPMRYFSVDRICEDLKIILKKEGKIVRLLDSSFLLHPLFYKICEKIKEINSAKKLDFRAFLYAEHINGKKATLLKECNFTWLQIGLQTIKSETLKNIGRLPLRKSKFIAGLKLLEKRKIDYMVDVMIGLPNDTLQDFKKTLKFVTDNKIRHFDSFVLNILPGTRLAREAKRYGIKYQSKPPHLLIETPYISNDEIEKALALARPPFNPFNTSLISYCNIEYPLLQKKNLGNFFKIKQLDNHIYKVILELDSSCQSTDDLEKVGRRLSRRLVQPFTIWFKTRNAEKDFALMKSFLLPVATSNPFLLWSIILESDRNYPVSIIGQIKRNISSKEYLYDDSPTHDAIKILSIISWKDNKKRKRWLNDIRKVIPFYWAITVSKEDAWQKELYTLFREKYKSGILIDFDPKSKIDFIVEALQFIYKNRTQYKAIFFRNLAIQLAYSNFVAQAQKSKDISASKPESILWLDKYMNISSVLRPSNAILMDLMAYQIRFQKIFKSSKIGEI